jgi:hypothetical protein
VAEVCSGSLDTSRGKNLTSIFAKLDFQSLPSRE